MESKLELYGFFGILRLFFYLVFTKIFFKKARLIRFPLDLRGRKKIDLGKNLTTGRNCRIEAYDLKNEDKIISFGENVEINDYVHIAGGEKIQIGNNVLIASRVYISDIVHGNYSDINQDSPETIPKKRKLSTKKVIIEDNVWIGENVSILPGVTVGRGVIIGANSVVTKNLDSDSIYAGIPAIKIKKYNTKTKQWEKIEKNGE